MFRETKDESLILKFWQDEQKYPQWYRDSNNAWTSTRDEHLDFCRDCWKIYTNDVSLVFVERTGNLHFSILRGQAVDIDAMKVLRDELQTRFQMIYGWANSRNRGLQKMLESIGFIDSGCRMYKGSSHGKILEWNCYVKFRESLILF